MLNCSLLLLDAGYIVEDSFNLIFNNNTNEYFIAYDLWNGESVTLTKKTSQTHASYGHGVWNESMCFAVQQFENGESGNMATDRTWIGKINAFDDDVLNCKTVVLKFNDNEDACVGYYDTENDLSFEFSGTFPLYIGTGEDEENKLAFFQTDTTDEDWSCSAQGFMIQYYDTGIVFTFECSNAGTDPTGFAHTLLMELDTTGEYDDLCEMIDEETTTRAPASGTVLTV